MRIEQIGIDTQPTLRESSMLPFIYAQAEGDRESEFSVRLYHCPTCPTEELRLTWDGVRRRHCGFCRECKKLWPLPRRSLTPQELRAIADQRQIELSI